MEPFVNNKDSSCLNRESTAQSRKKVLVRFQKLIDFIFPHLHLQCTPRPGRVKYILYILYIDRADSINLHLYTLQIFVSCLMLSFNWYLHWFTFDLQNLIGQYWFGLWKCARWRRWLLAQILWAMLVYWVPAGINEMCNCWLFWELRLAEAATD